MSKSHSDGGFYKFADALAYAVKLGEHTHVMKDESVDRYHVIRDYGHKHWLQHYAPVSEVKFVPKITGRKK